MYTTSVRPGRASQSQSEIEAAAFEVTRDKHARVRVIAMGERNPAVSRDAAKRP